MGSFGSLSLTLGSRPESSKLVPVGESGSLGKGAGVRGERVDKCAELIAFRPAVQYGDLSYTITHCLSISGVWWSGEDG